VRLLSFVQAYVDFKVEADDTVYLRQWPRWCLLLGSIDQVRDDVGDEPMVVPRLCLFVKWGCPGRLDCTDRLRLIIRAYHLLKSYF
jgi:hypothetical protein